MRDDISKSLPSQRIPRAAIHDSPIHFRAHAPLVDAAKSLAAQRGMSLAELMRHAMRRELAAASAVGRAGPAQNGKLSEADTSVRRAAGGDVVAQRNELLNALVASCTLPHAKHEALRLAEHWARMAALIGGSEDHGRLLSIISLRVKDMKERGDEAGAREMEAEGIAIVAVLADEGNEDCAAMLSALSDEADAGIMKGANAYVASWKAAS